MIINIIALDSMSTLAVMLKITTCIKHLKKERLMIHLMINSLYINLLLPGVNTSVDILIY